MITEETAKYMKLCLVLAEQALRTGNPPVGAILILGDNIIGTGEESARTSGDITDHAEILAIRDAVKNGYRDHLHLSRMFTTHEPCIMCSYVIRHHKIAEIIYGSTVPNIGGHSSEFPILTTATLTNWGAAPRISGGIFASECQALTEAYIKLKNNGG